MVKTTNYIDTFIKIADDCPVLLAEVPPLKNGRKTIAGMQYEMMTENPYEYTSDDVIFTIYACKNDIIQKELGRERKKFFSKGQACFRSSPLPKRYGWGVHSNSEGKIAIYAMESEEYRKLANDKRLKHLNAMRSKRV